MRKNFRFNLQETAGAIGDYGTLIPIILGVVAVTNMKLVPILIFFGVAYIVTGLYFKLPIPVEPMKAIGAIAIAGNLTRMEITGAGIIAGLIFIIIGLTGTMSWIKDKIPNSLIRGIQLGLAMTLVKTSINFIGQDWIIGAIAVGIIIIFYFAPMLDISSLVVLVLGLAWGIYNNGFPSLSFISWPELALPSLVEIKNGFINATLPQIFLTLGNSVLATSLLITDLFNKKVSEDKIVTSVGIMSLFPSVLGGFPMCHGAGGLAAQYRFGARTGGSNIISGFILIFIALFFASQELLAIIPYGILGALLFFSSLQLLQTSFKTDDWIFTVMTGILTFLINMSLGFIIMLILFEIKNYLTKRRRKNNG